MKRTHAPIDANVFLKFTFCRTADRQKSGGGGGKTETIVPFRTVFAASGVPTQYKC